MTGERLFGVLTLVNFVAEALKACEPEWIVTAERKGTALLRTYVEHLGSAEERLDLWGRVVSTDRLGEASFGEGNGIILVLDEGAYNGRNLARTLENIKRLGIDSARIRVAVFGVHADCRAGRPIDFRRYGGLSTAGYRSVRSQLVQCFQKRGSLLLDTEHVEVPVRLKCGRAQFFDALCRLGSGVQHSSGDGRANLTVSSPAVLNEDEFLSQLPSGSTVTGTFRKLRVVERGPNEYAILPIWFPSVPSRDDVLASWTPPAWSGTPKGRSAFYVSGLLASIHLFRSVGAALRDLIADGSVEVRVPRAGEQGDGLSHLRAMFGQLDIVRLRNEIETSLEVGRGFGLRGRQRLPERLEAAPGTELGRCLGQVKYALTRGVYSAMNLPKYRPLDFDRERPEDEGGGTYTEVVGCVSSHLPSANSDHVALVAAALDQLIDEAIVIPTIGCLPFADGRERLVRTFRLDGELVRADVARISALHGNWGPALAAEVG